MTSSKRRFFFFFVTIFVLSIYPTKIAFAASATYRINEVVDENGKSLSVVKVHVDGVYLRGRILVELQRNEEAAECFNRVYELDPKYPHLKRWVPSSKSKTKK